MPAVDFGRRGEHQVFERICRYEVSVLPAAFVVFDLTLEHGGLTYSDGEQGVLFMPERGGRCPGTGAVRASVPEVVSRADAAIEYARGVAITRPSTRSSTDVVLYQPNPAWAEAQDNFPQFGLDVGALIGNDMLPATHMAAAYGLVCLEGPSARRIDRHISASKIADPDELVVSFHHGSCRDVTFQISGRTWPEVEPF